MTREQLDAIRARVDEAANRNWSMEAKVLVDARALLAEVERLRDAHAMAVQVSGELCEKCGWAMRFPGEKCRCDLLAEVERLRRELDKATNDHIESQRNGAREAIARKAAEADVERLTALTEESEHQMHLRVRAGYDKTVADSWRAWAEKQSEAAFARGVAAMREAAARYLYSDDAEAVRALPDPEDTE